MYRPYIRYETKIHQTANNSELHTIGSVKLQINIRNVPTFIVAEVAIDLCTGLILGNDWITQNGIDIITTKQCIRKRQGLNVAVAPFSTYNQQPYSVSLVNHTRPLPKQQTGTKTTPDLKCRVCQEKFTPKKKLLQHLKESRHYSNRKINGSIKHVKGATNHQQHLLKTSTHTPSSIEPNQQLNSLKGINQITVFTSEQLKNYQQQDIVIKRFIGKIDKNSCNSGYCMNNGLLCRNVNRFNRSKAVPVVPKSNVNDVLLAYHNLSVNGAHFGIDRTYYKIRDLYYWPKMYLDVAQHVRSCSCCSINKYLQGKTRGTSNSNSSAEALWRNSPVNYLCPITLSTSWNKNSTVNNNLHKNNECSC